MWWEGGQKDESKTKLNSVLVEVGVELGKKVQSISESFSFF